MDPKKLTELANLLRQNGDKILNSEFSLTLSGTLLRALNDSFTLIVDAVDIGTYNGVGSFQNNFQVAKPINSKSPVFNDIQLIYDFVQKTTLLRIMKYAGEEQFDGNIDISKFRALRRLEVQKENIKNIVGLQALRAQLQQLICNKALHNVEEIIIKCGGDCSQGFMWNELKSADFSYNNLQTIDTALEFAQYLQHLNLRHNQLSSANAIKWLPHLKTLDLSFNRLTNIPELHMDANKRLQTLNLSNNELEDLMNLTKLEALTELDLSDNCLLDHICLWPVSALLTLRYLNLSGNPLYCHPEHRLATAQFLHANTSTVKFVLDSQPLSKQEKAITGTHQQRSVVEPANYNINSEMSASTLSKKRNTKMRTVVIDEHVGELNSADSATPEAVRISENQQSVMLSENNDLTKSMEETESSDHLTEKRQTEELRKKYGADWLIFRQSSTQPDELESTKESSELEQHISSSLSGQLFNDYMKEFPVVSTPTHDVAVTNAQSMSNISAIENLQDNDAATDGVNDTVYLSAFETEPSTTNSADQQEILDTQLQLATENEQEFVQNTDEYSKSYFTAEAEISEPEDDEATYIVYNESKPNDSIFLTISSNFLREKDAITQHTKAKWSLKILESCERLHGNTLRLNFDTVKLDKQERVYAVEDALCQSLERYLRDILEQRNLSEMNQTMYRCVNCSCQFSQELKTYKETQKTKELRCPDCNSSFVAEIHDIPEKPALLQVTDLDTKLSPASVVEASHLIIPLVVENDMKTAEAVETTSIGSAHSYNDSSSCSKISNSQSSFDSNQSVVGSSNTDREQDFKSTGESEVEIISNPSQSSIEVLDQNPYSISRKTSEERRPIFTPNLPTIDDQSYTQSCIDRFYTINASDLNAASDVENEQDSSNIIKTVAENKLDKNSVKLPANKSAKTSHPHVLTESSSSGSVTDSVCTAYEQQNNTEAEPVDTQQLTQNFLTAESKQTNKNELIIAKPAETDVSTSLFGAFLQSTNLLMTSSKKLIEAENSSKSKSNAALSSPTCQSFKFNYTDFSDADHRIKLYFYQTKFELPGERFKWLVRGRLYNAVTQNHFIGIIVMSTCKCYVLEAFATENDDVNKWLRLIVSVTVDRLKSVQLLPWKMGFDLHLYNCGEFLLLFQDILRTDSLLLFLANNPLPASCELHYQPQAQVMQRLSTAVANEQLKMCSLINECIIICENEQRHFNVCCLIATDTSLCLSSEKLGWLTSSMGHNLEVCLTQTMINLIEVDTTTPGILIFNFQDESENKWTKWSCSFETQENAESCLNAVSQSWEKLFGVSLMNAL